MKFLQPPIQVCRGAYIPYFKINTTVFCCPLFIKNYLNPSGQDQGNGKRAYRGIQP